jgi:hypothetical protein
VDQHDRVAAAGASFDDLDVAAGQADDATAGHRDLGGLGFAVGDQRVDPHQDRKGDRDADQDLPASSHCGSTLTGPWRSS